MNFAEVVGENKGAIAFTLLVLVVGIAAYAALGVGSGMKSEANDSSVFEGIRVKVAYAPDGSMKLFANARNNALDALVAEEGGKLPEGDAMVVGYSEAGAMRNEKLFNRTGDVLLDFFGLRRIRVGGVLAKTGSPVDYLHFLDAKSFDSLNATAGKVFVKTTPAGDSELVYYLGLNETAPAGFVLAEGSLKGYTRHYLGSEEYYPLVLGAMEARAMRGEGEFRNTGDAVRGFLGTNFVVAGVLKETGTGMDIMHFVPLRESELG